MEFRKECQEKPKSGIYTPWENFSALTHSPNNTITLDEYTTIYVSDNSDEIDNEEAGTVLGDSIYAQIEFTWSFMAILTKSSKLLHPS